MVRHVILWKIKEDKTEEEKQQIRENAKLHLEALIEKIEGIEKLVVNINPLSTSTADLMLDSAFESEAALASYAVHADHVFVADNYIRPFMEVRICLDFEE